MRKFRLWLIKRLKAIPQEEIYKTNIAIEDHMHVITLHAEYAIDNNALKFLEESTVDNMVADRILENMANALKENISINKEMDERFNVCKYEGTLQILS